MNIEDYARHITQKYRLAISIAMLNTKPDNLSIDEYIEKVKSNIIKKNINNYQKVDDSLMNISACSDDFNIHESDDNYDQDYMNQNRLSNEHKDLSHGMKDHSKINTSVDENQFNDNERPRNDEILFNDEAMRFNNETVINGHNDGGNLNTNTVPHNFEELIDANKERREKFREVIQVLKGVDVIPMDQVTADETQRYSDNRQAKLFDPMDLDLTQCYDGNYSTLSNSTHKITNSDKTDYGATYTENFEANQIRQDTYKQVSQDTTTSKNIDIIDQNEKFNGLKTEIMKRMKNNKGQTTSITKTAKKDYNVEKVEARITTENNTNNKVVTENASYNSLQMSWHKNDGCGASLKSNLKGIQDTPSKYSQYYTHYSASEMNEVNIDNKLIYGNTNNNQTKEHAKELGNQFNTSCQEIFNRESQNDVAKNIIGINSAFSLDAQKHYLNNDSIQNIIQNETLSCPINIVDTSLDKADNERNGNLQENNAAVSKDQNMDIIDNTFIPNTNDSITDRNCVIFDKTLDIDNDKEDKREKIPFKIIEEMNRIKVYLKRKEFSGCSSVYKSSQSFGCLRSTQPESIAIEQSAFSLFYYIATCPLVTPTQVLTEQISEVLGNLIDRLHEKEIYPQFLEELLNTINQTLKLVHEEENYVFDVLQNKDEQIQRIILLNKSTHIQKFTIGKINNILRKLLDEKSADTTSEIQDINRMENLCYIFHILQIILPKYKTNYLKPSQNSQDDKILKKTDITEMWRKKWIANFKDIPNEGSSENNCVLKECSEILNKIVLSFMDGYSLIAYSALQCFNLMQS